jgi:Leucine-rich repeat (LRR) protein
MATFITSKTIGQTINIAANTSTGYWKYNNNGSDSSVFADGLVNPQAITVAAAEFTLIPCLSDGTTSGDITYLILSNNQITSFDGTGLSSLTNLQLQNNQLTSFNGTGLSSLYDLVLFNNQLTTFDGTDLTSLTVLELNNNPLTSFDGTGLSSLTTLDLNSNQLTTFDGTGLSSLTTLNLNINDLTSFDGTDLSSLTDLILSNNQLTTFDGTGLTSLNYLDLRNNQIALFLGAGMCFSPSLKTLYIGENPIPPAYNDQILSDLVRNGNSFGYLDIDGLPTLVRTTSSNADFTYLTNDLGWAVNGTYSFPSSGLGKIRVKGITQI